MPRNTTQTVTDLLEVGQVAQLESSKLDKQKSTDTKKMQVLGANIKYCKTRIAALK